MRVEVRCCVCRAKISVDAKVERIPTNSRRYSFRRDQAIADALPSGWEMNLSGRVYCPRCRA